MLRDFHLCLLSNQRTASSYWARRQQFLDTSPAKGQMPGSHPQTLRVLPHGQKPFKFCPSRGAQRLPAGCWDLLHIAICLKAQEGAPGLGGALPAGSPTRGQRAACSFCQPLSPFGTDEQFWFLHAELGLSHSELQQFEGRHMTFLKPFLGLFVTVCIGNMPSYRSPTQAGS